MRLSDLNKYQEIVIQCHDNPDADAIASGFGLYLYYKNLGKKVRFIYAGRQCIQKSNLVMMVKTLHIPIEYVTDLESCELLLLTDCQYGEGNVTKFSASQVAMIDHHELCVETNDFTEIRPGYGSCCTVVYSMLNSEGFDIKQNENLATALYYGLYMDTNCFGEIKHPLDLDMMEALLPNEYILNCLKNANFTLDELVITGSAIANYEYEEDERYAVVQVEPCDPNILGFISDLVLQVDNVDICIVYNELDYGYKLSVRSCRRDVTANDLAEYLTEDIGSGGGHKKKAGGFIVISKYEEKFDNLPFKKFLAKRMKEYFTSYDTIDALTEEVDCSTMQKYQKLCVPVGFAKTLDFAEEGTMLVARTLEGDVTITADANIYVMIGINGEVYPMKKDKFDAHYNVLEGTYTCDAEYQPTVHNKRTNEVYSLVKYAKVCIRNSEGFIYAKKVNKTTKVFTRWYYDDYMLGKAGDYLAVSGDGDNDVYIIQDSIMKRTYQLIT
ncbi:MAG: DHH family phosphoesterase [Clostridiales bacterium]|nr:DHH family phosphoesterase [Clostridiales bacterium]